MRSILIIVYILLGILLATLTLYLVLPRSHPGVVTCKDDNQCGGTIVAEKFCKDGNVYGSGQQNTCTDAGTSKSKCQTTYGDVLVQTCKNGCENNSCV